MMENRKMTSELISMYFVLQLATIKCKIGGKTRDVRKSFLQ